MIPWAVAVLLAVALAWVWLSAKKAQRALREQGHKEAEAVKAEGDRVERQLRAEIETLRADLGRCQDVIERQQAWARANR